MHHRRTLVLAVGALLLATPTLSSCGFNYATDRINTTQHGATNRDKSVDVLAAVIIAEQPGSGTLSARLVNNDSAATELSTIEGSGSTLSVSDIEASEITAGGAVAVADLGEGIRVDGDFKAGEVVPLTMTFANGDQVTLDVPVVKACGVYAEVEQAPPVGAGAAPEPGTSEAEAYSCDTQAEGGH